MPAADFATQRNVPIRLIWMVSSKMLSGKCLISPVSFERLAVFIAEPMPAQQTRMRSWPLAARALENAEVLLMMQYDEADRVRGHFERGTGPLMSLKAGIVDVLPGGPTHVASIQDSVRAALREARRFPGPHLIRRGTGETNAETRP